MSRRWARASLVVASAHFSSKLGIGVHVSAFHPGNQAPEVNALTSALPGVIGLIVVIIGLVCLSASYQTPSKPFQFSDFTVGGTISGPSGGLATNRITGITGITGRLEGPLWPVTSLLGGPLWPVTGPWRGAFCPVTDPWRGAF